MLHQTPSDRTGGRIAAVAPGSPAERGGVRPDDLIVSAGGRSLTDVIAWWWESDSDTVALRVERSVDGGIGVTALDIVLAREPGEPWGIEFAAPIFDGVRTCANRCSFCFMAQLPPGLRPALYLRDDDYRLSFLSGNFITLTNLTSADVGRIVAEQLSPLYVSLHAVTPEIRARLLCPREDRTLDRFDELIEGGIEFHVQIVLVPGVNDGEELQATLDWLARREGVLSVGVVPLGYTAHQTRFTHSYERPSDAAAVLDALAPWAAAMRERDGISWVHAADELYLSAGREIPSADDYDGFPQYENGIGLVRSFLDEFDALTSGVSAESAPEPLSVITGTLFAPVLTSALDRSGLTGRFRILPVENRLFGGNVSVTGLLGGEDIVTALTGAGVTGEVLLPTIVLNDSGLTLDDMTVEQIALASGTEVTVAEANPRGLLSGIL